jgi:hypothetical protein
MAISAKKRRSLPRSAFGVPSKRKYPLDTRKRARNALARVSQHGTAAQKKAVRAKVRRKYPSITVAGTTKRRGTRRRKKR